MSEIIIASLSRPDANVEQIADDFSKEYRVHRPQLHVELANIICSLCKIPSIPRRMIENGDLTAINAFLLKSLKPSIERTCNSIKDLLSLKAWPNVPIFFQLVIYNDWDFLSASTKFNSFFNEFLNVLTVAELPTLRFLSTAVQLDFTTVCSVEKTELLRNEHRPTVLNYTKDILRNSFHDYERKIWNYSLTRMCHWFRNNAFLLEDRLLRFLLWGLTDRLANNSHLCLQISLEVLDEHHEKKELLVNFLQSFVRNLTPGLATQDMNFFEKLCDLAIILHNKYEDVGRSKKFVDLLLQFTFAAERIKSKAAASVFMLTKLRNSSPFEQLRCIVHFLAPHNSVFAQLFVDAMIEDYPLLCDWHQLAAALEQLTEMFEKETLLLVILCVVSSVFNGETPPIRAEKPRIQPAEDSRAAMTSVFQPLLQNIVEEHSFRWKILVAKIATYFDMEHVPHPQKAKVLKFYVDSCIEGASDIYDVVLISTTLHLVIAILQHGRPDDYEKSIIDMKTGYEQAFVKLERRLHQVAPKDFVPLMSSVIGLYACRGFVSLDERCLYDVPVKLLQMEPTDNVLLSFCHEVAILLSSDYVVQLLAQSESSATEGLDIAQLERIEVVFSLISECLNQQFHSRIGELAFFAQCRMVKALFSVKVSESQRNLIFTKVISQSLCTYVALALRNIQVAQLDFELSTFSVENIIFHFSDLILSDILPLECAYELLHAHCCQTSRLENQLREFLLQVVTHQFADEVAQWIFNYFAEYFRIANENLLVDLVIRAKRLYQVLYSIRNPMSEVLKRVHKLGIDLAVSRLPTKGGLLSVRFLSVLVEFSPCLGPEAKRLCFEYFKQKQIVGDLSVARLYFNSLRVGKRRSVVDSETSASTEELDEPEERRFRSSHEDSDQSESDSVSS